jgi:hypothetical protein
MSTQRPFDPDYFIPFHHTLASGKRPNLQLSGIGGHCQMADERIFGLAGAGANDR